MPTPSSIVKLCANSLIKLGEKPITAFDSSESERAAVCVSQFYQVYDTFLSACDWYFARVMEEWSQLTDTPADEFDYAIQYQDTVVKIIKIYSNGETRLYSNRVIYCNETSLVVDHIKRIDPSLLPFWAAEAVEWAMSSNIALAVTDNAQKAAYATQRFQEAMSNARMRHFQSQNALYADPGIATIR